MSIDLIGKLQQALKAASDAIPTLPYRLREFAKTARENPRQAVHHPVVWVPALAVGVAVSVMVLTAVIESVAPAGAGTTRGEDADKAVFLVRCTNSACGNEWRLTEDTDFDSFPVRCPKCGQKTGYRLFPCPNLKCRQRVVPTETAVGQMVCPQCKTRIPAAEH